MKKIYLLTVLCSLFMACSVDSEATHSEEVFTLDVQHTKVNNEDPCRPAILVELCTDDIDNPTLQGFTNFFKNQVQLNTDLPLSGNFTPTMAELLEEYQQAGGVGIFTTNYNVATEACGTATATVSVKVSDCTVPEPACPTDILQQLCASEIDNPTLMGFRNYYKNLIFLNTDQTYITGTFNPTMAELLDAYNQSGGVGTFTTNYTYEDETCGTTTIEVAVEVIDCTTAGTPPCVEDIFVELCSSEIENPTLHNFRNYYRNLIFINTREKNITGTFSPTLSELHQQFIDEGPLGTFATNYTFTNATCGDITIEVAVEVMDCTTAGTPPCVEDIFVELCSSQIDDPSFRGFRNYFRNLIFLNTNETNITGTFSPTLSELYEQFQQQGQLGTFVTNYTAVIEGCGETTFEVAAQVTDCD